MNLMSSIANGKPQVKKIVGLTVAHLAQRQKKVVNENNKLKSERIAALKEQNIELYMKLVSTEKNSRLM